MTFFYFPDCHTFESPASDPNFFCSSGVIPAKHSYSPMNWIKLQTETQLDEIKERSNRRAQLIFKHSTRCSTSALVKGRLERAREPEVIDFYYLDLLNHRPVSNKIADIFGVGHESPQVLLIRDGECIYDESHLAITMDEIIDAARA
jgi:bacillithiol system protein YtxJ